MNSKIEQITPELAEIYLARSKGNPRFNNANKFNENYVARYASDMKNGLWQLTHQGIAFNENGDLIDGHHRLKAIIVSGITVPMYVTYGVKDTDSDNKSIIIDANCVRTSAQWLKFSSDLDPSVARNTQTGVPSIYWACVGMSAIEIRKKTTYDKYLFLKENEIDIIRATKCSYSKARKGNVLTNNATCVYGAFCALKCGVSEETLKNFFGCVNTGRYNDDTEYSSQNLRNHLLSTGKHNHGMSSGTTVAVETEKLVQTAIKDFVNKKPIARKYTAKQLDLVYHNALYGKSEVRND